MEALFEASAPCDDDSLHRACINLHMKCVKLLIENHADPNLRSATGQGLTALAALCRRGSHRGNPANMKEIIRSLINANVDLTTQFNGKSVVLLALDNPKPLEITRVLLDAGLKKHINDDAHMFVTDVHTNYSPSMYVKQGLNQADPKYTNDLLRLLQNVGCKDRFYATVGLQPTLACGLPQYLIDEERERQEELERQRAEERAAEQQRLKEEREAERRRKRELELTRQHEIEMDRIAQQERAQEKAAERALKLEIKRAETLSRIRRDEIEGAKELARARSTAGISAARR